MRNKRRPAPREVLVDELVLPRHLAGRPHLADIVRAELERRLACSEIASQRHESLELPHQPVRRATGDHHVAEQLASSIHDGLQGRTR